MIPCGGRPFIEWVIRCFASQGVGRFVVSLGHLAEIAEAYFRERIFDPYVTANKRGTGLGLAVCRRIANEHHAQLSLAPGSVQDDATVIAVSMWRTSFGGTNDFGLGSAIAVLLFVLVIPVILLNIKRFRSEQQ